MNTLLDFGRTLFAIPIGVFGVEYLLFGQFRTGLPPVPPWAPGGSFFVYLTGVILIVLSVSILINRKAQLSATILGFLLFFCVVVLHAMHIFQVIHKGNERTGALEPLAFAAAAWVLAGALASAAPSPGGQKNFTAILARIGLCIFAFSILIFGIQHFMYAEFIATLITSWIPFKLFWTYLTGVGMIGVAVAIFTRIYARFACLMLAAMFFLWVIVLHAPLVATHLNNYAQWTSLFVALGMGGASLIVAAVTQNQRQAHR
jgi:uncharacterized membrane protein